VSVFNRVKSTEVLSASVGGRPPGRKCERKGASGREKKKAERGGSGREERPGGKFL
jgi:hypothetical protein